MFHFFTKKKFLVDVLEGFIDIHNHILPGIDDGAKNIEESISLIKGFGEFGVKDFIATPHIMSNYYPNTPETIGTALSSLKNELTKNNMDDISIEAAAEHMIDDNFETILEQNQIIPIKDNYLLIEMSYLQPSINFDTSIKKIADHNYYPIFAHPERYKYMHNNFSKYPKQKNKGLLFQLNLLSLGDYYGSGVQKIAHKLLTENLYDFAGTDVHNLHQLQALKNLEISEKTINLVRPIIERTIGSF